MFSIHPHRLCRTLFINSCLILTFLCFAAPLTTHAQDLDEATMNGRVTDPNGAPVPGATVTARLTTTGDERTATTGDDGRYRLIELQPGTYQVRVTATGFADTVQNFDEIISGQTVRNDVELTIGIADNVEVTTEPPTIDITRTVVGGTITTEELESLPNVSRQALDFVFTLPGVTEESLSTRDAAEDRATNAQSTAGQSRSTPEEAGNFALSGSPAYSNNITIDGLDNNDDRGSVERFQPSIETIEEVQVITNQFAAEYGRASGGRVNIRTRAGTNRFRGRGFYFFRDEALNANTFNNNRNGLSRFPLQQHNPGFTFSGPVFLPRFGEGGKSYYNGRDRTFFFAGYEYDETLDTTFIDTLVPILSNPVYLLPTPTTLTGRRTEDNATGARAELAPYFQTIPTPNTIQRFSARLDHRYTDKHNGTFAIQYGQQRNQRQFANVSRTRLENGFNGLARDTQAFSYTDNFVFSPTVVNQLRTQFSILEPAFTSLLPDDPIALIFLNDSLLPDNPLRRRVTLTTSTTLSSTDRREERFQIQDTLSVVAGKHSLKFGGDVQTIRSSFRDRTDATGTFNFNSAGDFLINRANRFRQSFGNQSLVENRYVGVFVQDEWQLRPNLSLSYGLRYENETILEDTNNFGPRLAVAYDPFKSGKTVIRAGGGIFYNRAPLRTIDDFILTSGNAFFDTNTLRLDANGNIGRATGPGTRLLTNIERQDFIAANIPFPGRLTADNPFVRNFAQFDTSFFRRLDADIRIPESYQFNVGFERDIGGRFVAEANYTYNRGIHLFRITSANAPRIPNGFKDLSEFLRSQDFNNRVVNGTRPFFDGATINNVRVNPGDTVRFVVAPTTTPAVQTVNNVTLVNLASNFSGNNATQQTIAFAVVDSLRPEPNFTQVERLGSIGNSFYNGLTLELRRRFSRIGNSGLGFSTRVGYTFSKLEDDGILNTSEALIPGDFRNELTRSLLDRRHRFVFSGAFDMPRFLGSIRFSPILRVSSGAPFNISSGGVDRNLDDTNNDRPNFTGNLDDLRFRERGTSLPASVLAGFQQTLIGQNGNLPRNAGTGPGQFIFDITATRDFRLGERVRLRPFIEAGNVLNKTVFTFGSEFINFDAGGATLENDFLVPTRTLRPRQLRAGLRFDF
ncbi:MAG: carboxypeptidase regulatory-like domain-containing protein [Pyrinomonadaceae bacterium MAG19_C2-C3]|nr:carboxypeptidase regulatory-like domain-containing protein [Pyrinomonadaceae bacterium MAG19_C2-C3]